MEKIFGFFGKKISWLVLWTMGWKPIQSRIIDKINKNGNMVMIFPHTSYVDFYIMLLYLMAYKKELKNLRFIVKAEPFSYANKILRYFQCIPGGHYGQKNNGATQSIIEECKNIENVVVCLSPKGTIEKREWRSGYFYIANSLKTCVCVIGLDYRDHCVKDAFSPPGISGGGGPYNVENYDIEELEKLLKFDISLIVPLYPECEIEPTRFLSKNDKISIIDWVRIRYFFLQLGLFGGGVLFSYIQTHYCKMEIY